MSTGELVLKDSQWISDQREYLERLDESSEKYEQNSYAENTARSYRSDWTQFAKWCMMLEFESLPASIDTIKRYLIHMADSVKEDGSYEFKLSTIQRRFSSINQVHKSAGFEGFSFRDGKLIKVWKGIKNDRGVAQTRKAPAVVEDIKAMVGTLDTTKLKGIRDRAILLLGFAGAFRRSEIVNLNVDDVEFTREGMKIRLLKSKTNQQGDEQYKAIHFNPNQAMCPIHALQEWLKASCIESGPLFRSVNRHDQLLAERTNKNGRTFSGRLDDKAVANIVKKTSQAAGLKAENYSGHSLRAGFVTSAYQKGASYRSIKKQTGHKSDAMLEKYIRIADLFVDNATSYVW